MRLPWQVVRLSSQVPCAGATWCHTTSACGGCRVRLTSASQSRFIHSSSRTAALCRPAAATASTRRESTSSSRNSTMGSGSTCFLKVCDRVNKILYALDFLILSNKMLSALFCIRKISFYIIVIKVYVVTVVTKYS